MVKDYGTTSCKGVSGNFIFNFPSLYWRRWGGGLDVGGEEGRDAVSTNEQGLSQCPTAVTVTFLSGICI